MRAPIRVVSWMIAAMLLQAGCFDWSSLKRNSAGTDDESGESVDALAEAESSLSPTERTYLKASEPFLKAMVAQDYAAAFRQLAPSARKTLNREQFALADPEKPVPPGEGVIENPTDEQFASLMREVESKFGVPATLGMVSVETDPEILSRRDRLGAAFELGGMPDSIPVESRKAAVQGWVDCAFSEEDVRSLAEADGITPEEVRRRRNDYEGPYFKIRTVVVDEGSGPVIGYFEIAPPSIWD